MKDWNDGDDDANEGWGWRAFYVSVVGLTIFGTVQALWGYAQLIWKNL